MDGIIQLLIGALGLWIAFGLLKNAAKAFFFIFAAIAVIILCWGAFDMIHNVVRNAAFALSTM